MRSFILTWNPNRWEWVNLSEIANSATPSTPFKDGWSTGNRYDVPVGSEFFLLRQVASPLGIMGCGKIVSAPDDQSPHHDPGKAGNTNPRAGIEFHRVINPYRQPILTLDRLEERPELAGFDWKPQSSSDEIEAPLAKIIREMWQDHVAALHEAEKAYPQFVIGTEYRRREIHEKYGGQQQGGISTPGGVKAVFLFTGDRGSEFGYRDGFQSDGTFWYTGEGQVGDMKMVRGNRAILGHGRDECRLYLFESAGKGHCRFLGEGAYLAHHETTTHDREGNQRKAIVFELEIMGVGKPTSGGVALNEPIEVDRELTGKSLAELRELALIGSSGSVEPKSRKAWVRIRNQAVKLYVLKRASGVCEGCGQPAPFKTRKGMPYLEPHHLTRLADEGPDHPDWVAALCPNCHRRVHFGKDGADFNLKIGKSLTAMNSLNSPNHRSTPSAMQQERGDAP